MAKNDVLVTQNTGAPSRKQNFNLLGSQLTTMVLVIIAVAAPTLYERIPPEFLPSLGSTMGGLFGFALGYWAKERA